MSRARSIYDSVCSNESCLYAYTIPPNSPKSSKSIFSIDSTHLLCANESCPYQIEFQKCVDEHGQIVDINKICSLESCPYKIPYKDCFPEPPERMCPFKDCPFKQKYGKCGIEIRKVIEQDITCTNEKCRLRMLCRDCTIHKKKIALPKLCDNEYCPYKFYYEECTGLGRNLVNVEEDNIGMCTNELCPYKTIYKQCEVFASEDNLCNIKDCPYQQIFSQEDVLKKKVEERVSNKDIPLCTFEFCPYRMMIDKLARTIESSSLAYNSESIQCDSLREVCWNEECLYTTEYTQCNLDVTTDICSTEICPYKIDPTEDICSVCSAEPCFYISEGLECDMDETGICSDDLCPYSTVYVDCFPDAEPFVKRKKPVEEPSETKYKYDACSQFTDIYFIIDDILYGLITAVLEEVTCGLGDIYPVCKFLPTPCDVRTCEIKIREKRKRCNPFRDVYLFAEQFIEDIISDAKAECNRRQSVQKPTKRGFFDIIEDKIESKEDRQYMTKIVFCWPSIKEFTIPLGAAKIKEYVTSFDVQEQWLCGIYYIKTIRETISQLHHYEVICGLPTTVYPIPQATASIFFVIEVSKVIPKTCPVHVTFQIETNRCVHNAEITVINERWLLQVLNAKIKIYSTVHY